MLPPMAEIVLATCNGKWCHPALGLRSLLANMGPLAERTRLLEFDLEPSPVELAEAILAPAPRILGLSLSIWNRERLEACIPVLRALAPDLAIVVGGPEVHPALGDGPLGTRVDCFVEGEGELVFPEICRQLLDGGSPPPYVVAPPPPLDALRLPWALYEAEDLVHRVIYVETSRGCPHSCAYCRSARDAALRFYPLAEVLRGLDGLLDRGCRAFKFVDRSFNASLPRALALLDHFLARPELPDLTLHFEMLPHRFPEELRRRLRAFPPGALHLELGVQSFDEAVGARVGRPFEADAVEGGLRFLRDETGADVHADLIVGLPGEDLDGFGRGFDRLAGLRPGEIQVNLLKRLAGTPLADRAEAWGLVFAAHPPYEILRSDAMSFETLRRLHRFGRYWALIHDRGHFPHVAALLREGDSVFRTHLALSDWLWERTGRWHHLGVETLAPLLFAWLVEEDGRERSAVVEALVEDHRGRSERRLPRWLSGEQAAVGLQNSQLLGTRA